MEVAQTAFLVILAIIGAILTPFIVIYVIGLIGKFLDIQVKLVEGWLENIKKRPPFDEVEVNVSPATNVMTARFLRNGVVIWQGASSRREMEENGILKFDSQDINND
jgi:hypothetical protein